MIRIFFAFTLLASFMLPLGNVHAITLEDSLGAASGIAPSTGGCISFGLPNGVLTNIVAQQPPIGIDPTSVPVADRIQRQNTGILKDKECLGDKIGYILSQALLAQMTDQIITWINDGSSGGPAYVTNLGSYLGEISDTVAVNFIESQEFGSACTPFQQPIREALVQNYQSNQPQSFSRRISCSFDGSTGNIDSLLKGDFAGGGGWLGLFQLSTDTRNNPLRVYFDAVDEQNQRITSEQFVALEDYRAGDGFISKGSCDLSNILVSNIVEGEVDIANRIGCLTSGGQWNINFPGDQISSILQQVLSIPIDRAVQSDETGEVLNQIFASLLQQLLGNLNGLNGLSSSGSGFNQSGNTYLQQLTQQTGASSLESLRPSLIADISLAINLQQDYQAVAEAVYPEIITGYEEQQAQFTELQQCATVGNSAATLQEAEVTLQSINANLQDFRNVASRVENTPQTIAELEVLLERARTAGDAASLNSVGNAYSAMIAEGRIFSSANIEALPSLLEGQRGTFVELDARAARGFAECR